MTQESFSHVFERSQLMLVVVVLAKSDSIFASLTSPIQCQDGRKLKMKQIHAIINYQLW